jgi:heme-degrading monooxygenase HmoA
MVLEMAVIDVQTGSENAFEDAYRQARPLLISTPGCNSARMTRGVESPSRFVLLAEWDSVEAHEDNFRATERFVQWRALLSPYFSGPPVVEHFTNILI